MKNHKQQLLFGRHPVLEALQNGQVFDKVWIQQGTRGDFERQVRLACRELEVPVQFVPKEKLNRLVKGNHQGIVASRPLITYQQLDDILPLVYEHSQTPLIILLDGVSDVRNFGAIARSAEVCGAHALVIPIKGSAHINSDAIKSSAGALNIIPVCRVKSLVTAIDLLKQSGIQVVASSLNAKKPIEQLDLKSPTALVIGSEGEGISRAVERNADELFIIPQVGQTDSFNVSVAAGIMLYETLRQRGYSS